MGDGSSVTWIERGETFAVVTWGSSSCPPVATGLTAESEDHVVVTFGPSPNDPCTADMAPTTHEFALPDRATRTPVTVEIRHENWAEVDTQTLE